MSMPLFGLLLLPLVAVFVATGLPMYLILLLASFLGASVGLAQGVITPDLLRALPGRLINLLEHDLLQALPLYLLMGALLNRLGLTDALFRVLASLMGGRASAPTLAGLGLGALLGPMNGSVGASVLALSRTVGPSLVKARVSDPKQEAIVALAGTLGVVVPPSLVLILLGDALLTAHSIASNATGARDRIINTQDLMRGVLPAAGIFIAAALIVAAVVGRQKSSISVSIKPPDARDWITSITALAVIVVLLGGVATGYFFAVEAAAAGAVLLFAWAALSGKLGDHELPKVLSETLTSTGVLFAPLLAATTFTLVLRLLGTDKLVEQFFMELPGGAATVLIVGLGAIALSALALDAFEIIFVVIPILAPPILMRVPDATWVGVLILLVLQAIFLLPPFGAALILTRSSLRTGAPLGATVRALLPFLACQLGVLALILSAPRLVHVLDPPKVVANSSPALTPAELDKRLREMAPSPGVNALPGVLPPPPPIK